MLEKLLFFVIVTIMAVALIFVCFTAISLSYEVKNRKGEMEVYGDFKEVAVVLEKLFVLVIVTIMAVAAISAGSRAISAAREVKNHTTQIEAYMELLED